jgi:hypothetical protein
MLAKSATQLFELSCTAGPTLRLRRMLVLLTLAVLGAGTIWLADASDAEAYRVATVLQANMRAADAAHAAASPVSAALVTEPPHEERHHALSEFLARRYNISQDVTFDLVTMAHAAGRQIGLDPLLIIAVMAVESRFNPLAESVAGAKGLMQVIPRYHVEKFREVGGDKWSVFDPETNILVGSQILKEYLRRTGNLTAALQLYVGSPEDNTDGYTGRVMNEKQRLQQFLRKLSPAAQQRADDAARSRSTS